MADSVLRYPLNIDNSLDYIRLELCKYEAPLTTGQTENTAYTTSSFDGLKAHTTIFLPMPGDIQTQFGGNWGGKDTTSLAQASMGLVANKVADIMQSGDVSKGITGLITDITNAGKLTDLAKSIGDDALKALGNSFSAIPGMGGNLTTNDILNLTKGSILNPNTELLYGGVPLRSHGYNFKLIAQSDREAEQIDKIIQSMAKATLPEGSNAIFGTKGKNFLSIPDLVKVTFLSKDTGGENKNLPKYRASGITGFSANYITDGNYIAYKDGRPLGANISISLTETKIPLREDYGDKIR